jgi:hypothetical protein
MKLGPAYNLCMGKQENRAKWFQMDTFKASLTTVRYIVLFELQHVIELVLAPIRLTVCGYEFAIYLQYMTCGSYFDP